MRLEPQPHSGDGDRDLTEMFSSRISHGICWEKPINTMVIIWLSYGYHIIIWLVVSTYPSSKMMEFVNGFRMTSHI